MDFWICSHTAKVDRRKPGILVLPGRLGSHNSEDLCVYVSRPDHARRDVAVISGQATWLPGRAFTRHFCIAAIALLNVAYVSFATSRNSATAVERLCLWQDSSFSVHNPSKHLSPSGIMRHSIRAPSRLIPVLQQRLHRLRSIV